MESSTTKSKSTAAAAAAAADRVWKYQRTKSLLFLKTGRRTNNTKSSSVATSVPLSWWSILLLLITSLYSGGSVLSSAADIDILIVGNSTTGSRSDPPGLLEEIEPARVSCDAAYNLACARTNSQWLAIKTANDITRQLAAAAAVDRPNTDQLTTMTTTTTGTDETILSSVNSTDNTTSIVLQEVFESISNQSYNVDIGFYPFVFDKYTGICMAHGAVPELLGLNLGAIFDIMGIGFSRIDALEKRFVEASESPSGGGWVKYMWSNRQQVGENNQTQIIPHSKYSYVVTIADRYYLGVGYEKFELPIDVPCTANYDSWCSITNVRSLTGKAQALLTEAESLTQFEDALFQLADVACW